jgi:hypothetical protein
LFLFFFSLLGLSFFGLGWDGLAPLAPCSFGLALACLRFSMAPPPCCSPRPHGFSAPLAPCSSARPLSFPQDTRPLFFLSVEFSSGPQGLSCTASYCYWKKINK